MSVPTIHVVGVGFSGAGSLSPETLSIVESATMLVGGNRHLEAFKTLLYERNIQALPLDDFTQTFKQVRSHCIQTPQAQVVMLASGDPLFFGLGRILLTHFSPEQLTFHPHVSAIQLAFSRIKQPWQNATLLSVHGRSEEALIKALKRGDETIAVLTDGVLTPSAIAALINALDSPAHFSMWVCENLGSEQERVRHYHLDNSTQQSIAAADFSPLNVVILQRQHSADQADRAQTQTLPLIGLPDAAFKGFPDRPTLITKREIRLLILGELAPAGTPTIWDIGAGTGSVSIELSRLCPTANLYAIEKTAMGAALIKENSTRLAIASITAIQGKAPSVFQKLSPQELPPPNLVFIGGSSGALVPILNYLSNQTSAERIVLAIATLENLTEVISWSKEATHSKQWHCKAMQINVARSAPIGPLTRFLPLTPITLVTLTARSPRMQNPKVLETSD